jgi:hypothetical protein
MNPNSARSLRNQCQGGRRPVLKQCGEWLDADEWSASPDGKLWNYAEAVTLADRPL